MQQSDYLIREIEKISLMILGLIGKLKKEKQREMNQVALTEWIPKNANDGKEFLEVILNNGGASIIDELKSQPGFTEVNLELCGDLLIAMYEATKAEQNYALIENAIEIYRYIDSVSAKYSMERAMKINSALVMHARYSSN